MPKIKSKKTLLKRIKVTKGGKIVKKSVSIGHLKRKWSSSKKNRKNLMQSQPNAGHKRIFKKLLNKMGKGVKINA